MEADDPVALLFGVHDYPVMRGRLIGRLLAYACGIGYVTSVVKLARGEFAHALPKVGKSRAYAAWEVASMLAGNGVLFGALAWAGHPLLYVTLWIVPSVTLLPLAGQVRAIFEHAGLPAGADQSRNARTIVRPSWQTFLFGPHAIHFHIEHHLFARVPFHHLPVASAACRAAVAARRQSVCGIWRGAAGRERALTLRSTLYASLPGAKEWQSISSCTCCIGPCFPRIAMLAADACAQTVPVPTASAATNAPAVRGRNGPFGIAVIPDDKRVRHPPQRQIRRGDCRATRFTQRPVREHVR